MKNKKHYLPSLLLELWSLAIIFLGVMSYPKIYGIVMSIAGMIILLFSIVFAHKFEKNLKKLSESKQKLEDTLKGALHSLDRPLINNGDFLYRQLNGEVSNQANNSPMGIAVDSASPGGDTVASFYSMLTNHDGIENINHNRYPVIDYMDTIGANRSATMRAEHIEEIFNAMREYARTATEDWVRNELLYMDLQNPQPITMHSTPSDPNALSLTFTKKRVIENKQEIEEKKAKEKSEQEYQELVNKQKAFPDSINDVEI